MAGITHLEQFSKPALRGLVDAMENDRLEVETYANTFLPEENTYSNTFAYDVIKKSNQIAAMIGVGAEPPVVDRDAVASRMGELAKYGIKAIVTEEELLQLNQPRNSAEEAALVEKLTVKGADLVKMIQDRIDVSKSQVLTEGKISYNKNGVKTTVDYTKDMPKNHKIKLEASKDWTNDDADIIGDLLEWVENFENNSGQSPEAILMSRETQALLLKNKTVITEATGSDSTGRGRVSVAELNSVLSGYGLPSIQVVTKRKVTVKDIYTGKDEVIEYFHKHRVVMVAKGVGKFLFGPTVEKDFQPGIVLDAYDKDEPIQSILRSAAAGFPIIENPNLLLHADVVSGSGVAG